MCVSEEKKPEQECAGAGLEGASEMRWYALYTRCRHEKDIRPDLDEIKVEHYLPVVVRERRWKDRRKSVEVPLFPSYVFVRCDLSGDAGWDLRRDILQVRSVVRILSTSEGVPEPIPDQEIFNIRTVIEKKMRVDPYEGEFVPGQMIRIRKGPLAGVEGVLEMRKGIHKLVLQVRLLNQSVAVTLSAADVEKMG